MGRTPRYASTPSARADISAGHAAPSSAPAQGSAASAAYTHQSPHACHVWPDASRPARATAVGASTRLVSSDTTAEGCVTLEAARHARKRSSRRARSWSAGRAECRQSPSCVHALASRPPAHSGESPLSRPTSSAYVGALAPSSVAQSSRMSASASFLCATSRLHSLYTSSMAWSSEPCRSLSLSLSRSRSSPAGGLSPKFISFVTSSFLGSSAGSSSLPLFFPTNDL
mmetsp:Transcript_9738/g.24218  ORF Transcript_9738/g.24218 Transcript_9738/m.24218 type:complete len:228 (-) Transcript_9738:135-818(-)